MGLRFSQDTLASAGIVTKKGEDRKEKENAKRSIK
jgi:hypothetical protein